MGPKKHLGQHFLTAVSYAERIARSVGASRGENVLEIGPGKGALSVHLKTLYPFFHCVEVDADLVAGLAEELGPGTWTLHRCDALAFDFAAAGFPLHVVGNLPYSIGAMIIKKTLSYGEDILSFTFMVQREVAQRIAAKPHSKQMGFLSVFCQFFGAPEILFTVPPGAFFPKPAVDSAVVRLVVERNLEHKLPRKSWEAFFKFVDSGFRMRRKMLANVLGRDGGREHFTDILTQMNMGHGARAEDLSPYQWLELYKKTCGI
ncbi:MAG TPA: 16S rRNA (adenine(1518)-N(6)/adenine(1519)-N(6))-dimethyltransferase RsmA [Chitinivibrionales bacterium]|nr:16S rRNA (adenine(1518)-N(6)/adenine(1519)-N(6))-dimethyltransferase RsmA [Chitinivibrionales bacterium]